MSYECINIYDGTRSPSGQVHFDLNTAYFFRSLYERLISLFEFVLPEGWNKNYFLNVLYGNGFIGIVRTDRYGIIPQICTVSGYGLYLQPTDIIVAQPLVQFRGKRGEDCELIRLTQDFRGIIDIVEHYARQLAVAFTSVNMSLYNSRISFLGYAKSKQGAETLKELLEKIYSGEPAVVTDRIIKEGFEESEPIFTEAFNAKDNYLTDKLLSDMKTIISDFDREIGIPVIDDKKERRIEREVSLLTSDSGARCKVWERCLTESLKDVKRVFPDLDISFKYSEGRGVYGNVIESTADNDRYV